MPDNQNERVLMGGVFLVAPAPLSPTYLYVREPQGEYLARNKSSTGITVQVGTYIYISVIIIIIIILVSSKQSFSTRQSMILKDQNTRDHSAGNGDPMHGVSQDTSRMGTARVKQEEEADMRIIVKEEEADTGIIVKEEEADTGIIVIE